VQRTVLVEQRRRILELLVLKQLLDQLEPGVGQFFGGGRAGVRIGRDGLALLISMSVAAITRNSPAMLMSSPSLPISRSMLT
jgi:hypothetical protein